VALPVEAIVTYDIALVAGLAPPAKTPRTNEDIPVTEKLEVIKVPKVVEFPVEAIVIYTILFTALLSLYPPANNPLVLEEQDASYPRVWFKFPKLVVLLVVAIVI
jgi:hypothetical protein